LKRFLKERIANYKVPKVLSVEAALPLLPNGGIDRQESKNAGLPLRELLLDAVRPASMPSQPIRSPFAAHSQRVLAAQADPVSHNTALSKPRCRTAPANSDNTAAPFRRAVSSIRETFTEDIRSG